MAQVTRFEGYAAVWDRADRAGDVVRRGAFGDARRAPLLWDHQGAALGEVSVAADARGLRVEGVVEGAYADAVRSGAVRGLSVGYRALAVRRGAWRELLSAELLEVSLVRVPMQALARVDRVE